LPEADAVVSRLGLTQILIAMPAVASPVYQLIYHSLATKPLPTAADNALLLHQARINNARLNISGLLLYAETTGEYLQVLEGTPEAVKSIYQAIATDPRHHSLAVLAEGETGQRVFPDWRMGFAPLEAEHLAHLTGYIDPRTVRLPGKTGPEATPLLSLLADFARTRDVEY
jgi:Sensors of blue-light using FAD